MGTLAVKKMRLDCCFRGCFLDNLALRTEKQTSRLFALAGLGFSEKRRPMREFLGDFALGPSQQRAHFTLWE